jgi:hypothetical protein
MSALGTDFGVSGNGLKKICIRHSIPMPPAGYFLMSAQKKRTIDRPLQNLAHNPAITITASEKTEEPITRPADLVVSSVIDPDIAKQIDDFERLLRRSGSPDERGILRLINHAPETLIRCSREKLAWSAEQLKAILNGLQSNGIKIDFAETRCYRYDNPGIVARASYQRGQLDLRVEEYATRQERPLTASEAKQKKKYLELGYTYYQSNRWLYTPTGKPQLTYGYSSKRKLSDDTNAIVAAIINELKKLNEAEIRSEIKARQEKAVFLKKLRPLRTQIWRKRQLKRIEEEAAQWERAEQLRRYVDAVRASGDPARLESWLPMANALIDQICPIRSGRYGSREKLPKYAEVKEIWRR